MGERGAGADYLARLERLGGRSSRYVDGDRVEGLAQAALGRWSLNLEHSCEAKAAPGGTVIYPGTAAGA